jgi:hypothetical protein
MPVVETTDDTTTDPKLSTADYTDDTDDTD